MRPVAVAVASLVAVFVLAACAAGGGTTARHGVLGARTTKSTASSTTSTTSVCQAGTKVAVTVIKGPHGATMALVPVTIDGKGPFAFALDTGAAKSAIDSSLARRLGLKQVGTARNLEGIAGSVRAKIVRIVSWNVGSIKLRPDDVGSLDLFGGKSGPAGLFGSDVLSRFSSVCLDYRTGTLRVGTQGASGAAGG